MPIILYGPILPSPANAAFVATTAGESPRMYVLLAGNVSGCQCSATGAPRSGIRKTWFWQHSTLRAPATVPRFAQTDPPRCIDRPKKPAFTASCALEVSQQDRPHCLPDTPAEAVYHSSGQNEGQNRLLLTSTADISGITPAYHQWT
jgi:hypothetical protein